MADLVLRTARATLRSPRATDVVPLLAIRAAPEVAEWWGAPELAELQACCDGSAEELFLVIEADGEIAGAIQAFEEEDAQFRHASIDLFLGPRHCNRGLGPEVIHALARYLAEERGHHRLTIDPAVDNVRAVRAYAKVGFRPVGVLRRYEILPGGGFRDGLLMDVLAEELVEPA
jgi:aminoglycoside 6'-N-acetyltransferase